MKSRNSSGGNFVASLIFFSLTAVIAIMLIITAIVIWLSDLTGSFILSALIVGGFFAVISLVVYMFAIRDAVDRLQDQVETIYEVAQAAKTGYEWVSEKILLFLKLRDELRSR